MNVIAESWGQINEFRSVLVRLREFESKDLPAHARRGAEARRQHAALLAAAARRGARIGRGAGGRCSPRRSRAQWTEDAARRGRARPRRAPTGVVVRRAAPTYGARADEGRASGSLYPERL